MKYSRGPRALGVRVPIDDYQSDRKRGRPCRSSFVFSELLEFCENIVVMLRQIPHHSGVTEQFPDVTVR